MPPVANPTSTTLPADAKCPRCGYEFGIAGQTRCSECGLALDDRTIRKFRLRKLAIGLGINIAVIGIVAVAISLRVENWSLVFAAHALRNAGVAIGALILSLLTGSALAMRSRQPERVLCMDAWARSHFLLFAQWIMLPDALRDNPVMSATTGFLIWIALVIGGPLATGVIFFTLRQRRQINSTRSIVGFVGLAIAFAAVHTALFVGIVLWSFWNQLGTFQYGLIGELLQLLSCCSLVS